MKQTFFGLLLVAVVTGCATAPSRFYTLAATAKPTGAPVSACAVIVGPVFIPAGVDRPQFTVVTAPNRVEFDEFNRWAAPLNESIARVVAADLGTLLGTTRAVSAPMPDFGPADHVLLHVERFETLPATAKQPGSVLVDVVWVVRGPDDQPINSGHTVATETATGPGFDALAAAHSRALAQVSADIAAAIRRRH